MSQMNRAHEKNRGQKNKKAGTSEPSSKQAAAMMSKIFFVLNKPKYDESLNKKKMENKKY